MAGGWEHFDHGADIGVRGFGTTMSEAFANAALAMTAVATEIETVEPRQAVTIACEAPDDGILLVDWLNALVYEMAEHGLLFSRFEVEIEDGRLHATARGEPVDRARHSPAVEIKGATMTELSVRREDGGWIAQCVVDV